MKKGSYVPNRYYHTKMPSTIFFTFLECQPTPSASWTTRDIDTFPFLAMRLDKDLVKHVTWTGCKIMVFAFGTVFDKNSGHSLPTLWDHCIFRGTTQHGHLTESSILGTCPVCSCMIKRQVSELCGSAVMINFPRSPRVPGGSAVIASARGRRQNPQNLPVNP